MQAVTTLDLLQAECPRRMCGLSHADGTYQHYTSPLGFTGCFHYQSTIPEDWYPSLAQAQRWQQEDCLCSGLTRST